MQALRRLPRHAGLSRPLLLFAIVIVGLVAWRLVGRVQAQSALREQSGRTAIPAVTVRTPSQNAASEVLVLPGTVQAWTDAPIYARTAGYLKQRLVDIGQHVKAGQLLAEIDAPEVDQQLSQAQAELATAETNSRLSQRTAERYRQLLTTKSVAPQDAEEKMSDAEAKKTAVASAQANVQRLRNLQGFKRVVAPFDGVVTERNVDVGALIVPGGASGQALFRVASTRKLRVYVEVPESLARGITARQTAELRFASQPARTYPARVSSTASAITPGSRTLLTQLEIDNADGGLLPGSSVDVLFKLPVTLNALRVPVNTLLFRADGLNVVTVDAQSKVLIKPVVQGRDFGSEVEIVNGLQASDRLIVNPPDSAATGTEVRVLPPKEKVTAPSAGSSPK